MSKYDVSVVGHGVVGAALALQLGQRGLRVLLVGEGVPPRPSGRLSPMVYALNHASESLLRGVGVWSALQPHAQAYGGVQVWDAQTGAALQFDARMVRSDHVGHIVSVPALRWALWEALQGLASVQCLVDAQTVSLAASDQGAVLTTTSGVHESSLLVGADGARSWVRDQLQAPVQAWSSHQTAITAVVRSERPHGAVARQVFMATGPLALLPCDAQDQQVMVWSADDAYAQRLLAETPAGLAHAAAVATGQCLGDLTLMSAVKHFPLSNHHVKRYCHPGVVLIGDAAHRIHPLAGQGANLGLADVQALCEVLQTAQSHDLAYHDPRLLGRYARARRGANGRMLLGCDALRRCFSWKTWYGQGLRAAGMQLVQDQPWLKQRLLAQALGL